MINGKKVSICMTMHGLYKCSARPACKCYTCLSIHVWGLPYQFVHLRIDTRLFVRDDSTHPLTSKFPRILCRPNSSFSPFVYLGINLCVVAK